MSTRGPISNEAVVGTNTGSHVVDSPQTLVGAHLIYTSDATVGNRQILLEIKDAVGTVIMDIHAGAVQAASLVLDYEFLQGIFRETAFVDSAIQVPVPMGFVIPVGGSIVVRDSAGIAITDSYTLKLQLEQVV